MLYNYTQKIKALFLFYLLIALVKGEDGYETPESLKDKVSGFLGFKCNFSSEGIHNLEPDITEYRSVFCSINSYFVYDKVRIIVPKKEKSNIFKILPGDCFQKVYSNFEDRVEKDISEMGLVEYEISEDDSSEDYTEKIITISPFNTQDIEFFCFCDNTEKVISNVEGRSALVYVHVLKYPHDIISINLTNDSFPYLNNPKSKDDFKDNNLEIKLKPGELLVLACEKVDVNCFQKPKNGNLYKSNKIIYHKKFSIFKAPSYTKVFNVDATCTCKVDSTLYNVVVKPKEDEEKKIIYGCNFTENDDDKFSNNMDLNIAEDNKPLLCQVELKEKNYDHLIGLSCPGEIVPDCFFQVYEPEDVSKKEPSKIVYLDAHLNIGDIEHYEDSSSGKKVKLFGLVGKIPQDSSFVCMCKKDKKTGYMFVQLASGYFGFLANMFIFLIVIILLNI